MIPEAPGTLPDQILIEFCDDLLLIPPGSGRGFVRLFLEQPLLLVARFHIFLGFVGFRRDVAGIRTQPQ